MNKFRNKVIEAGKKMCEFGLTVGTWGNISIRNPETGNIYITPSGMDYETLCTDDIVKINPNGDVIDSDRKPSIELPMHYEIYMARDDLNAIIHTHPTYSSAFAITEEKIPPISEDFVQIVGDKVICAEYSLPGTEELAQNVVEALSDRNAVLLTNHGTLCTGNDMNFAFKVSEVVEKTAYIYLLSRNLGEPRIIPEDDIIKMQEFVKNSYGQ